MHDNVGPLISAQLRPAPNDTSEYAWPAHKHACTQRTPFACAVDLEHPWRLAHAQNDVICAANRLQRRTADSAHIGGYLNPVLLIPITLRDKLTVIARRRMTTDR
jgi:hypothetical protein